MNSLVAVSSKGVGLSAFAKTDKNPDKSVENKTFKQGDIVNTIITCENGETIGHLFMQRLTDDKIKFGLIIVDNTKRGQGLGKRMLESALVFAKEKYNPKSVVLSVFDENPSAAKCYISLGFAYNKNERTIFHEGKEYVYREMEYLM